MDIELSVDVPEVVLDRLRAEERRRCRLASRSPLCQQERDLELLRCQLVQRRDVAPPGRLSRRVELRACELCPRRRADLVEGVDSRAQLFPRALSLPGPA